MSIVIIIMMMLIVFTFTSTANNTLAYTASTIKNSTMTASSPFSVFGRGGTERMAAYPLLIWIIGFGGYLMGSDTFQMGRKIET
jgi:hypothetical protein